MNQIETLQTSEISDVEQLTRLAQQCAHDIRSPLSALNMLVSTLNHMSEEQRSLINQVVDRINCIADDLLNHSRSFTAANENTLQTSKTETVFVRELIEETVTLKQLEFQAQSFSSEIQIDSNLSVEANENEMKRVLSNLINNSMDAGSTSIRVSARKELSSLVLTIVDNGVGIPSSILSDLISGKQLTYGKPGKGNGLGLSHAMATINGFGGSLVIDSKLGQGTTITIYLLCN